MKRTISVRLLVTREQGVLLSGLRDEFLSVCNRIVPAVKDSGRQESEKPSSPMGVSPTATSDSRSPGALCQSRLVQPEMLPVRLYG